jgi:hypothetical protein
LTVCQACILLKISPDMKTTYCVGSTPFQDSQLWKGLGDSSPKGAGYSANDTTARFQ